MTDPQKPEFLVDAAQKLWDEYAIPAPPVIPTGINVITGLNNGDFLDALDEKLLETYVKGATMAAQEIAKLMNLQAANFAGGGM